MQREEVGVVTHYFNKIGVAVVELTATLQKGDKIVIEKGDHVVEQIAESMQIDHEPVEKAEAGQAIGLKVNEPVKEGAKVYRVKE